MDRARKLLVLPVAGVVTAGVVAASAFGATSAPKVDHLTIRSGTSVNPGHWIKDNLRYTPFASTVRSGGTIVIKGDKGAFNEGPHTFSIVKRKQLPKTAAQINNCSVCGQIAQEHGVNPNDPNSQPTTPFVDGGDGFNKPGDSVVFQGKGPDPIKVTAKKGTTLYYMCAVHPWMQGKVIVK